MVLRLPRYEYGSGIFRIGKQSENRPYSGRLDIITRVVQAWHHLDQQEYIDSSTGKFSHPMLTQLEINLRSMNIQLEIIMYSEIPEISKIVISSRHLNISNYDR
jgi:hypothetical protein